MEYIYGALLLHSAGKKINEKNMKKIIKATGKEAEDAQIKSLVTALEDVEIEDVIKNATSAPAPAAAPAQKSEEEKGEEEEKEEKKESEKKEKEKEESEEEAAEGLSGLFG